MLLFQLKNESLLHKLKAFNDHVNPEIGTKVVFAVAQFYHDFDQKHLN